MRSLLLFISTTLLISCSSNETEINRLRTENQELKSQLNELRSASEDLENNILVIPASREIMLGEDYEAMVCMAFKEKAQTTRLTLYDNSSNPKMEDTLKFESQEVVPIISFTPKDTGRYDLRGTLTQTIMGQEYEMIYLAEFDVNEKK